jgi:hypothetical protein
MKFSAENPRLRKAAKRHAALLRQTNLDEIFTFKINLQKF